MFQQLGNCKQYCLLTVVCWAGLTLSGTSHGQTLKATLKGHTRSFLTTKFSPDGNTLASNAFELLVFDQISN